MAEQITEVLDIVEMTPNDDETFSMTFGTSEGSKTFKLKNRMLVNMFQHMAFIAAEEGPNTADMKLTNRNSSLTFSITECAVRPSTSHSGYDLLFKFETLGGVIGFKISREESEEFAKLISRHMKRR
ncbi:hypothetical protein [Ancylobacter mangrovi]|uniref:hypothetical protein n=1 Tax=Ancylobacter mangrovi TaxID=2972472 RepID=UPI0021627270|nr:hypothetical protein [Ancylobacter mangrovi]MCS0501632.1 hypothetical protein [Ancylobacter mangrovi]